jgi:nucleotide-binding universal stress UspA family protein
VIGRPGEDEGVSLDTIEGALIDSGRPLLIPPAAPLTALPETVAIAWKATPQAARALTAASPFLSMAKQIVVLTVVEDQRAPEDDADRLMTGLRWHGVPISVRHLQPDRHNAADTLLSAVAEHAALLVMGGYGHSRLREWIFGGFTLSVLRGAEVPVLMAH